MGIVTVIVDILQISTKDWLNCHLSKVTARYYTVTPKRENKTVFMLHFSDDQIVDTGANYENKFSPLTHFILSSITVY